MSRAASNRRKGRKGALNAVLLLAVTLLAACGRSVTPEARKGGTPVPALPAVTPAPDTYAFRAETTVAPELPPLPTFTPVPKDVARQILLLKKAGEDEAIPPLMEELAAVDPGQYAEWERVLAYWDETQKKGFVSHKGLPDGLPADDTLCIVALGYRLHTDGSMRDELKGRLQVVLAAAQKYPNAYVLVSGGGTASESLPDVTEAGRMAEWLIKKGVEKERIIVEDRSTSTYENILFCTEKLRADYPGVTKLALVTSDYHIPRGALFFTSYFIRNGIPLEVAANAAYTTGKGDTESRDVLAGGVARIYGLKTTAE